MWLLEFLLRVYFILYLFKKLKIDPIQTYLNWIGSDLVKNIKIDWMMKCKTTMIGIVFFPSTLIQSKLWAPLSLIPLSEIGYMDYKVSLDMVKNQILRDIIHHVTPFNNLHYQYWIVYCVTKNYYVSM